MKLPLCYRAGAARAISQIQQRQERRAALRAVLASLRYFGVWLAVALVCAFAFFGVIALMADDELDPPPAQWVRT